MRRRAKSTRPLTLTERMQRIRKTDTKPEMIVRRLLHSMGFRYRLHGGSLPGRPDIVLPRHQKVIFVHGCFWHRHQCRDGCKLPMSKPDYWGPKLERNRLRDAANVARLREMGWDVLVIWECELRDKKDLVQNLTWFLMRTSSRSIQ